MARWQVVARSFLLAILIGAIITMIIACNITSDDTIRYGRYGVVVGAVTWAIWALLNFDLFKTKGEDNGE
ncbi:MAG: hypothetical protein KGQ42_05530 [Alphaproteobacteria bacterium]|nr:hypothetical protein [Alphaproteobacteria bacterium]MDE2042055.1 hypothetical protein [Alphaproteobacteria bacterium]MDE2341726.1 hypothetical protein [Alphaproteobacteria bacterium]